MKVYYEGKIDYHKYYLSDYEYVEEADGDYKEISYIQTPTGIVASVINEKKNGVVKDEKLYYIYSDYLGSVEALTDKDGNLEARFSYGAWGNLRDPDDWDEEISILNKKDFLILERGYTGHEHLKEYDLINMNGRVYDQLLGQFIQPDNNISQPESSQGYNRYSYVLNNPLKYTDPSGENPLGLVIFLAVAQATQSGVQAYMNGGGAGEVWQAVGTSLAYSALSYGIGMGLGAIADGLVESMSNSLGWFSIGGVMTVEQSLAITSSIISNVSSSLIMAGISGSKYDLNSLGIDLAMGVGNGYASANAEEKARILNREKAQNEFYKNNPLMELETPRKEFQGFYRAEAKISMELEVLTSNNKIQPGNFEMSDAGLEFIKKEEGFISYVYDDRHPPLPWSESQEGYATIGYGQRVDPSDYPNGITKSEATTLLHNHLNNKVLTHMNERITVSLTQNQIDATASYVYNVGVGNAFGPPTRRFLTYLNNGNFRAAAFEMDIKTSGGVFMPGLPGRRLREQTIFLTR